MTPMGIMTISAIVFMCTTGYFLIRYLEYKTRFINARQANDKLSEEVQRRTVVYDSSDSESEIKRLQADLTQLQRGYQGITQHNKELKQQIVDMEIMYNMNNALQKNIPEDKSELELLREENKQLNKLLGYGNGKKV